MDIIKKLDNNKNIFITKDYNYDLYFEFQSYDRELTLKYISKWTKYIKDNEQEIKDYFDVDYFVINMSNNFNLDGLTETNNDLIFSSSLIYDNYTDDYLEIYK